MACFGRVAGRVALASRSARSRRTSEEATMPSIAKKSSTMATKTRQSTAPATQRSIHAFGRISKSQVQLPTKSALRKGVSATVPLKSKAEAATDKKRKLDDIEAQSPEQVQSRTAEELRSPNNGRRLVDEYGNSAAYPSGSSASANAITSRKKRCLRQSEVETPTKGARTLLRTLSFPSSSPSSSTSPSTATSRQTPPSSPISTESPSSSQNEAPALPDELQDLIDLHSSFLTVLSFHYAHNGSMTPADLRNLAPGIERAWRKRKATTDDIRRILALEQDRSPNEKEKAGPLFLTDYGHGKICVEIVESHHIQKGQRRPLNEESLHTTFVRNLERQWRSYQMTHPSNPSPHAFISTLTLLPITPCASLSKIAPLLSKGQLRLEDLKAGAIKAQQTPLRATTANSIPNPNPHPKPKLTTARSSDLFSRLKAKQLHQSTLPLPPSAELLARKSALQRIPDIAPVLDSLAVSSKKHCDDDASAEGVRSRVTHASFTMASVVQHLQMSLRNPIGREEAGRCVTLLAEVVPEWVGVREVGRLISVTVRGMGVGREELGRRIGLFEGRL